VPEAAADIRDLRPLKQAVGPAEFDRLAVLAIDATRLAALHEILDRADEG
jgi:hypothetical protein